MKGRFLNMADPEDVSTLYRMQHDYETAVHALLSDQESRAALEVLLSKGAKSSHVHGSYSALRREAKRES